MLSAAHIKFVTCTLLIGWMVFGSAGTAGADRTMRCSGRLVSIGDTRAQVRQKCDAPDRIQRWEKDRDTWVSKYYNYQTERYEAPELIKGPIQMERWTYDFGPTRLKHVLLFERDKLIRIESGDKASDSDGD
jgi:hypothetical protein